MSTTVTYKGSTLTTVNNQTRVLETGGTWLEDDITLTDVSASSPTLITKNIGTNGTYNASSDSADGFSSVVVNVPTGITPTGTKQINISQNGTVTEDVTNYANAQITVNVSGGGTPSATAHTIYFEFSDNTNTTITAYWDGTFISDAIRATTPTTYNNKAVTLAQLDGVTWYEPAAIPLNTELIDFSAVENNMLLDNGNGETFEYEWVSTSDYTEIDPSMTFTYKGWGSGYVCFYDSTKTYLTYLSINQDGEGEEYGIKTGTLTPAKIPSTAKYVRISSFNSPDSTELSLIRTA